MSEAAHLLALAIASMFWPALLAVVLVALRAPTPKRLLLSYLAGAYLTAMTMGLVVIYALQGSSFTSGSSSTPSAAVDIAAGALCLVGALVLYRSRPSAEEAAAAAEAKAAAATDDSGRIAQALAKGAPVAFVTGIVLNLIPGVFPLVAYKDLAEMDLPVAETAGILVVYFAIMFAFVEVPLIGYIFAPESTAARTARFNAWLDRNMRALGIWALVAGGAYLIGKGIVALTG